MIHAIWNTETTPTPKADRETPKLTVENIDNHLYFYSTVDPDRCLALMKAIREIDNSLRREYQSRDLPEDFPMVPIWLHVNSGGGSLFDALSVSDQLTLIKSPIYSIVEGYSASAASIISMACTKRYIRPSAYMMIHQFWSFMFGKYEEFKDDMKFQDMLMATLTTYYVDHSKMDSVKVTELLKHDSWFNAEMSLELGLADHIL